MQTSFGWVAGGSFGMLTSYVLFVTIGARYPRELGTFLLFVAGAFAGMYVADRSGPKGFRPLGIAAGVLLALVTVLGVLVVYGGR
jgi:hypothetical protein